MPNNAPINRLIDQIRAAAAADDCLAITGGGSKAFYGEPLHGTPLSTGELVGIGAYHPQDLMITVSAGTRLAELQQILAAQRQYLPFDPPQFSDNDTVGGMVATGLCGPGRFAPARMANAIVSLSVIDGQGNLRHFGEMHPAIQSEIQPKVKPVSDDLSTAYGDYGGYGLSDYGLLRVMVGSLGILALITEVSFRTMPIPPYETTVVFERQQLEALHLIHAIAALPNSFSASAWFNDRLYCRFSGGLATVRHDAQQWANQQGGQMLDQDTSQHFWANLRDQRHEFFQQEQDQQEQDQQEQDQQEQDQQEQDQQEQDQQEQDQQAQDQQAQDHLWRLSLPPTTQPVAFMSTPLLECDGGIRWGYSELNAAEIRQAVQKMGGHATHYRGTQRTAGVFTPLSATTYLFHQRLKKQLDPQAVFNRGRMYDEL